MDTEILLAKGLSSMRIHMGLQLVCLGLLVFLTLRRYRIGLIPKEVSLRDNVALVISSLLASLAALLPTIGNVPTVIGLFTGMNLDVPVLVKVAGAVAAPFTRYGFPASVSVAVLVLGLVAVIIIILLSALKKRVSPANLLMAIVGINSLVAALLVASLAAQYVTSTMLQRLIQ